MLNEDKYMEFVMSAAEEKGKLFIMDSGEGNDCIDPDTGWYIEDLSGWLIDERQHKQFLEARENGNEHKLFGENYVFAQWKRSEEGKLKVEFNEY